VFAHGTQEPDLKWKSLPENVGFVVKADLTDPSLKQGN
jgi:hypothetical protein